MASKDYLKLVEKSQNKKLKLARQQEKQIKEIYQNIYLKTSSKLEKANLNDLSVRYLESVREVIKDEIRLSQRKVKKIIKNNMLKASSLGTNTQLDFFMQINSKYELNLEDSFKSMFSSISKDAINEILFGKVYKGRMGLDERIWSCTKKFEKDIDYIIAEGIASKKSAYELAKDLEIYLNPDARKDWDWSKVYPSASKKVDYNAQRLARTSVNHAYQQAQKRSCMKNPYIEGIEWLSSNSHRTCELCNSRNGQIFKVNEVPLDHPNGMCTTIPVISKSLEDIGEELNSWINGASNPKLDKWLGENIEEFIV